MKQAYIAIALRKREMMNFEVETICTVLQLVQIIPFVFVDHYHFTPEDALHMMQSARKHMDESNMLIAEVSHKAIGVGVEVGYMAAQGKTIIYLRRDGTDYSTTVGGLATFEIVYRDAKDLREQFISLVKEQSL